MVTIVEPRPWRSSMISKRFAALVGALGRAPNVEDEQLDTGEHFEEAGMTAVAASKRERIEEPSDYRGKPCGRAHEQSSCYPTPVGPMISKFWCRSIHSPATAFRTAPYRGP